MTLENLRKAMYLNNIEMLLRLKKFLHIHENLPVLDQLAVTEDGHFTFEGTSLLSDIDISKLPGNAIEKKEDGYYVADNIPADEAIQKMINDMWKELMAGEHHFSTQWSSDAVNHWHECTDEDCEEVSEKGPHIFNDGVITLQPTFESAGITTYTCTVCGYTKESDIPHLEHTYADTYSSDATHHWYACTDPGYQNLYKDKAVHDWDEGIVTIEPDYETPGTRTFTCNDCGYQRLENIATLNHVYETDWTIDETYHWLKCSDEGYEDLYKDKAEHVWNAGVVTKEPDIGVKGEMTFTCTVCGATKTEEIDALEEEEEEVQDPIIIVQQPQDIQLDADYSGTVSIQAEGNGLTYEWWYIDQDGNNTQAVEDGNGFTGVDTNTLSIDFDSMLWGNDSYQFWCVITDADGNTITSNVITVSLPDNEG